MYGRNDVSEQFCQHWPTVHYDTIGFSDRRGIFTALWILARSPSTRLENKASKSQLLTLRPSSLEIYSTARTLRNLQVIKF
jgi:hypothetical protein